MPHHQGDGARFDDQEQQQHQVRRCFRAGDSSSCPIAPFCITLLTFFFVFFFD